MRASGMNFLGKEQVQTPNLDKLAGESTVFTNAHIMGGTSGAVSMPSRAMLMTGKYLYNLEKQGATIPNSHTMIGETLQKAGYNTFHTGKWHSSYEALNRCFKEGKAIFFGGMWDHWNVSLYDYHADMNYGKRRPVIHNQAKSNKVSLVVRVQLENVVIAVKRQEESDLQLTGLTVMGRPCFPDTTFFFTVDSILMTTIQNFDFPIRAF